MEFEFGKSVVRGTNRFGEPREIRDCTFVRGAQLFFRNFAGKPTPVNPAGGRREIGLFLTDEAADVLASHGCNIKHTHPRRPDEAPRAYVPVIVKDFGPDWGRTYVFQYSSGNPNPVLIPIESYGDLDNLWMSNIDLIITEYHYKNAMREGVQLQLLEMSETLEEQQGGTVDTGYVPHTSF